MRRLMKIYGMTFWGLILSVAGTLYGQDTLPASLSEPKLAGEWYVPEADYYGNQLFMNKWFRGDVFLVNGRTAHDKTLTYNVVQDGVIWLDEQGGKVVRLDKGLISGFVLRDDQEKEILFRKIRVRSSFVRDTAPVFVQVLYEGEHLSLYAQRKVEDYYPGKYGKVAARGSLPDLEPQPVYYIFRDGAQYARIRKIKRKELIRDFPLEKQQIKKILRKHHLSVRKETQLIKAVKIIDPLL